MSNTMKKLAVIFLLLSVSACSVHVDEMTNGATPQKFDLSDLEGDGVINGRDQCPKSFAGAQVNNSGCGEERIEKIRRKLLVNFANNSYFVEAKFLPEIKGLADFMKEYPSTQLTIEGHTSKQGSKALNQKLSQNRAETIKKILINEFAIDKKRITAIGYGFEKLLLEGEEPYIHARNRRIVAEISSEKSMADMKWTIYSVDDASE